MKTKVVVCSLCYSEETNVSMYHHKHFDIRNTLRYIVLSLSVNSTLVFVLLSAHQMTGSVDSTLWLPDTLLVSLFVWTVDLKHHLTLHGLN